MSRWRELVRAPSARLALEVAAVYAMIWAYLARLQWRTPHLPETDGYYHLKTAWIMRTRGTPDDFPWAQFSMWRDDYFDKDWGFHVLLEPFTFGDLIHGGKLAAVTFGAAIFAAFHAVLRTRGVRYAWVWTLLLASSGGYFCWRANVPRPHTLSIVLTLCSLACVLRGAWLPTLVCATAYALSYTAPHVVIVYAGVHLAVTRWHEGRWRPAPVAAALAGVLLGSLLHPHFPRNFQAWTVQLVSVLTRSWGRQGVDLHLGAELSPADTRSFLVEHLAAYVAVLAAVIALTRLRPRIEAAMVTLFVVANGFFLATCFSKRFVEYWVPLTLWLCAEVVSASLATRTAAAPAPLGPWSRRLAAAAGGVLLLVLFGRSHAENVSNFERPRASGLEPAARWLAANAPEGAQVFTCDWDDAPELFFHDDRKRYLVFLDPHFMYDWDAGVWELWNDVANGRSRDPVATIRERFDARYVACTSGFTTLRKQLEASPHAEIVVADGAAYLFRIADPTTASSGAL